MSTVTADEAESVCAHLAAIQCAQPPICAQVLRAQQGTLTDFHIACLLEAGTAVQASGCGTVSCP